MKCKVEVKIKFWLRLKKCADVSHPGLVGLLNTSWLWICMVCDIQF